MPEINGPVIYPAAVAIDWLALFSRIVMSRAPIADITRNAANARITLVSPTPSVHPVFAPTYKFVADSNPPSKNPVTADRNVSCGMFPRNTFASHHRSFCSRDHV